MLRSMYGNQASGGFGWWGARFERIGLVLSPKSRSVVPKRRVKGRGRMGRSRSRSQILRESGGTCLIWKLPRPVPGEVGRVGRWSWSMSTAIEMCGRHALRLGCRKRDGEGHERRHGAEGEF